MTKHIQNNTLQLPHPVSPSHCLPHLEHPFPTAQASSPISVFLSYHTSHLMANPVGSTCKISLTLTTFHELCYTIWIMSLLFGLISSLALYTAAPVGSLKYKSLPIINSDAFSSCFILTLAHGLCRIHALLTSLNSFPIAFPIPHSTFSPTSLLAALETPCCSLPPWCLGTGCSLPAVLSPPHPDKFTAHSLTSFSPLLKSPLF